MGKFPAHLRNLKKVDQWIIKNYWKLTENKMVVTKGGGSGSYSSKDINFHLYNEYILGI